MPSRRVVCNSCQTSVQQPYVCILRLRHADAPQRKLAFRTASLRWHPDRFAQTFGAQLVEEERDAIMHRVGRRFTLCPAAAYLATYSLAVPMRSRAIPLSSMLTSSSRVVGCVYGYVLAVIPSISLAMSDP